MPLTRTIRFLGWPILAGLIAAAALLLAFPERLNTNPPSGDRADRGHAPQALGHQRAPSSYAGAVKRAAPSVVSIYTRKVLKRRRHPLESDPVFRQFINAISPETRDVTGLGSGVILSSEGHILTNYHVIHGAEQVAVQLQDGRHSAVELVGYDAKLDLAVLKIELDNLTPIQVGDPMNAQVGDVVLAIGNPQWVGQTVTQGIVSATRRHNLSSNQYTQFIQTDAAINPGNSGGALVDAHGKLLGINTEVATRGSSYGISFAIPADIAIKVLTNIIEHGQVTRGWLGIDTSLINAASAEGAGLLAADGFFVDRVAPDGPADLAGLRAGDLITHINKHQATDAGYINSLTANMLPGDPVELTVARGRTVLTLNLEAANEPEHQPADD